MSLLFNTDSIVKLTHNKYFYCQVFLNIDKDIYEAEKDVCFKEYVNKLNYSIVIIANPIANFKVIVFIFLFFKNELNLIS